MIIRGNKGLYTPTRDKIQCLENECNFKECELIKCSECEISSNYEGIVGLRLEEVTRWD